MDFQWFQIAIQWIDKKWWGSLITYFLFLIGVYLVIWAFIEPFDIPNNIETPPSFTRLRISYHLLASILITSHIIFLLFIIQKFQSRNKASNTKLGIKERISFDSLDTNITSCWAVDTNGDMPKLSEVANGFMGRALRIESKSDYAIDYNVKYNAKFGSVISFMVKPDNNFIFYSRVELISSYSTNSSSKTVWIAFKISRGKRQPEPYYQGKTEWTYYVEPNLLEDGWMEVIVDLQKAVNSTFGTKGWKLIHLQGIRIRGNVVIHSISIY